MVSKVSPSDGYFHERMPKNHVTSVGWRWTRIPHFFVYSMNIYDTSGMEKQLLSSFNPERITVSIRIQQYQKLDVLKMSKWGKREKKKPDNNFSLRCGGGLLPLFESDWFLYNFTLCTQFLWAEFESVHLARGGRWWRYAWIQLSPGNLLNLRETFLHVKAIKNCL